MDWLVDSRERGGDVISGLELSNCCSFLTMSDRLDVESSEYSMCQRTLARGRKLNHSSSGVDPSNRFLDSVEPATQVFDLFNSSAKGIMEWSTDRYRAIYHVETFAKYASKTRVVENPVRANFF